MSAQLNVNTHQAYGFAYDKIVVGWAVPPQTTPYVDTAILNECIQELFGVELRSFTESRRGSNGSFTGTGPSNYNNKNGAGNNDTFTITTDVHRYSLNDLRDVENRFRAAAGRPLLGPNDQINGTTNRLAPLTNFTANDLKGSFAILRNQIHELGHSLDAITGIGYDFQKNGEAGKKLVDCVASRKGFKYR
ncbi:MAG: hypothetical protein ACRD9R_11165 [Pyrinomonadaceae bacterium]